MLIFVLLDHNYISEKLLQEKRKKKDNSLEVRFIVPSLSFVCLLVWPRLSPALSDLLFQGPQRGHSTASL
jgi:hypothetical protein